MQRLYSSSPTKASVFALVCVYITYITLEKLETKFTLLVTKKSESIVDVVIACDSKLLLVLLLWLKGLFPMESILPTKSIPCPYGNSKDPPKEEKTFKDNRQLKYLDAKQA